MPVQRVEQRGLADPSRPFDGDHSAAACQRRSQQGRQARQLYVSLQQAL
jgi:hypothetical protein